jgi:adenine-specific DNA-methyltransferase
MQQYIEAGAIKVGTYDPRKPQPYTLNHHVRREGPKLQRIRTVWWRKSHDAGTHGTTLLSRLLGEGTPFPFPKSVYAVRDCLEAVVRDRPDALIVDFFAGSGTTLHATVLLNEADGGRRRCVLVTNNEVDEETAKELNQQGYFRGDPEYEAHGIFEAATRPRVETVLTGIRPDGTPVPEGRKFQHLDGRPFAQGFNENCEFFRMEYLDPDDVELGRAFGAVHPLLWLIAGARGKRPDLTEPLEPFVVVPEGRYAVLFQEEALRELVAALNQAEEVEHVFLVTNSEDAYAEMSEAIGPGHTTHMLYRDYLRSFRITAA